MSDTDITNLDSWRVKLEELLKQAEQAAKTQDLDSRLQASNSFTNFILESTPNTPEIMALDAIADRARESLLLSGIDQRIAAISGRTGELVRLTKEFRERARINEASAASIRLEKANRVVSSVTDLIRTINELKSVVELEGDGALFKNLETTVGSLQKLRAALER